MGSSISSTSTKKTRDYYGLVIFGYKSTTLVKSSSTTLHLLTTGAADDDDVDTDDYSITDDEEIRKHINYTNDNVLYQSSLYGLGSSNSSTSTFSQLSSFTATTITDCGGGDGSNNKCFFSDYSLHDTKTANSNQQLLYKDLCYVDKTYYKDEKEQQLRIKQGQQQQIMEKAAQKGCLLQIRRGDAITFNDIIHQQQSMQHIDLSKRALGSICSNIGLLSMLKKLDLSYNDLREIPLEIGYLEQLEYLNLSHNQIEFVPDTVCHLQSLMEFNISNNQLQELTPFIFTLSKLQTLNLSFNQLKQITITLNNDQHLGMNNGQQQQQRALSRTSSSLTLLDLSYNQFTLLPAEVIQLPFVRRIKLDGCPLITASLSYQLSHDPPSLKEICARLIIRKKALSCQSEPPSSTPLLSKHQKQKKKTKLTIVQQQKENNSNNNKALATRLKNTLTESLYTYLSNYNICSHCNGPYFESFVSRGRWINREVWIPLEYRLCSAHWSTESDRMYSMFSSSVFHHSNDNDILLPHNELVHTTGLPPLLPPMSTAATIAMDTKNKQRKLYFFGSGGSSKKKEAAYDEIEALQLQSVLLQQTTALPPLSMTTIDDYQQEEQQQQPEIRQRSSSMMAATTLVAVTENESQQHQHQQQQQEGFSLHSAVKRWNYKVKSNSSSLFLLRSKNTAAAAAAAAAGGGSPS